MRRNEYKSDATERRKNLGWILLAGMIFLIGSSLEYRWDVEPSRFVEAKQVVNK